MEYTLTLRKVETGYKVTSFVMEDLQHAYAVATTVMQGPNYARCYLVCVDQNRAQMFVVHHGAAPVVPRAAPPEPVRPVYYSQPMPIQRPQRIPTAPCLPAYRPPSPQGSPYVQEVLDAEFEEV